MFDNFNIIILISSYCKSNDTCGFHLEMLMIFVVWAFSSQQHQLCDDMGESSPVSEDSEGFVDEKKTRRERRKL